MARAFYATVILLAACSSEHHETRDAAYENVDASPPDAVVDARPDAPPDASPDAAPPPVPLCTATVSVLADVAPSRINWIARADDTLYVGAYDYNAGDSNTRVLVYDLITGMPVGVPIPFSSRPALFPGDGVVWNTDWDAGSIWRLRPGASPEEIVSGRPHPGAVVADGSYVYWSEAVPPNIQQKVVKRRLLAGGDIETVMSCDVVQDLQVIGDDIYCAEFDGDIQRAPKTGGVGVDISSPNSDHVASMAREGDDLFDVTFPFNPQIFRMPTPDGPAMLVAEVPEQGTFTGIEAIADYIFVVGDAGVWRVDRATSAIEQIYDGSCMRDPVIWNNQLIFVKSDSQVLRCNDSGL